MQTHKKKSWQDNCKAIVEYHESHESTIRDIADEFGCSDGQACQCLTLGFALRVYPDELNKIKFITRAWKFIQDKGFRRHFD